MTDKDKVIKEHNSYAGRMRLLWSMGKFRDKYTSREHLDSTLEQELADKLKQFEPVVEIPKAIIVEQPTVVECDNTWKSKNQIAELKPFQKKHVDLIWQKLFVENRHAALLVSATGTGKTYMICAILAHLYEQGWHKDMIAPWPYMVVTKTNVVQQFSRVAKHQFGLPVGEQLIITSYDQLRSTFGDRFLAEKTRIVNGEPEIYFEWRPFIHPMFMVWDECHSLKNKDSQQSKIGQATNRLTNIPKQVFMSATVGTRLADFICFVPACRVGVGDLVYD